MQLTIIGAIQVLLGLALFMAGSVEAMFAFLLVTTLFSGSAAIVLGSLGSGSSIPPLHFALLFMVMRLLVPGSGQLRATGRAIEANAWLLVFVAYGLIMAFAGPRLFAGQFAFAPLRAESGSKYTSHLSFLLATRPFGPTPQNLTSSVYLVGTLVTATVAHVACKAPGGRRTLVRTMAAVGMIHCLLGFASVAGRGTAIDDVLGFFRNGSYAQLTQDVDGISRMSGIDTEPSVYAGFGAIWFVFLAECWLRRVEPWLTGTAALCLGAALIACTSTTAYVALAAWFGLLIVRSLFVPGALPADRGLWLAVLGLGGVVAGSLLLLWQPQLVDRVAQFAQHLLVDKMSSESGVQRRFWALQGYQAFVGTYGIGVGPGSFRSSSLFTAVLGCVGIIGALALVAQFMIAFKPLRWSTYVPTSDPDMAVAGACAWAMLMAIIVAGVNAPSCDPGSDFALLSGAALALRGRSPHAARRPALDLSPVTAMAAP
ncbi:hypothetical protein [Novosphingobium sp. FSW06-99]|uniref:hypothetical protein n=1 Tax=Novosphingobium sp. FSW06-99 TaxID=1739113 RepID=UPI00076DA5CB|nr:hypothetical protein [Novosphingobium sp. FSW06-99]KUR74308.1 hypothetical protein AQZ49_18550 [Novosphingobium sp. FSW06-99]